LSKYFPKDPKISRKRVGAVDNTQPLYVSFTSIHKRRPTEIRAHTGCLARWFSFAGRARPTKNSILNQASVASIGPQFRLARALAKSALTEDVGTIRAEEDPWAALRKRKEESQGVLDFESLLIPTKPSRRKLGSSLRPPHQTVRTVFPYTAFL
jgi:hypothetical protein